LIGASVTTVLLQIRRTRIDLLGMSGACGLHIGKRGFNQFRREVGDVVVGLLQLGPQRERPFDAGYCRLAVRLR
jgi:hypothetical protein